MTPADLGALQRAGLTWFPSGQVALRGPLLRLAEACDGAFARLAAAFDADEERHPASLPADRLLRADYLRSFPHQATFPMRMVPEEANIEAFLGGGVLDGDGHVALAELSPVSDLLTPAACYHLFSAHEGEDLVGPLHLTTRNTCFRQEAEYVPLRRLWSFSMREIVCVGSKAEVEGFRQRVRACVDAFLQLIDLPIEWLTATDPFFQPQRNPKHLLQRLQPVKKEATYGGDLAIGSMNSHYDHFGVNFQISRDGEPAHSCCAAFGIERWLFAITDRFGTDPARWPALEDAAVQAAAMTMGARV